MTEYKRTITVELNTDAINKLIEDEFRGNVTWFNEEVGVTAGYWWNILSGKKPKSSYKAIVGFIALCERRGWNFKKYLKFF